MTTAREHYQAGMDYLDAAKRQPDMFNAAAQAACATAHFAAAQAILTRYPEGMSQPGAADRDPADCRWDEPWQL